MGKIHRAPIKIQWRMYFCCQRINEAIRTRHTKTKLGTSWDSVSRSNEHREDPENKSPVCFIPSAVWRQTLSRRYLVFVPHTPRKKYYFDFHNKSSEPLKFVYFTLKAKTKGPENMSTIEAGQNKRVTLFKHCKPPVCLRIYRVGKGKEELIREKVSKNGGRPKLHNQRRNEKKDEDQLISVGYRQPDGRRHHRRQAP
jgi:hypothetical protein